jgi:hypothetical protein
VALLTALLLLAPPRSVPALLDASVAAHAKLQRVDVSIGIVTTLKTTSARSQAHLQFIRPDELRLTVAEPAQRNQAASRKLYSLSGQRVIAVDQIEGEYTTRKFPFPGALPLAERFAASAGAYGDAVGAILNPNELNNFYANFRNLSDFRIVDKPGVVELFRSVKSATITIDLGAKDMLLRRVTLQSPGSLLDWNYTYAAAPSKLAPPAIAGLHLVEALTARATPPHYADAQAKSVAHRSELAYRDLGSAVVEYAGREGSGQFWVASGNYREKASDFEWVYAGNVLSVRAKGVLYRGKISKSRVPTALDKLGVVPQPMLLQLLQGRNPMGTLLTTDARVRLAGNMAFGDSPGKILEIKNAGVTVSAMVRDRDGLLASVHSSLIDQHGAVAMREDFTYQYKSVNHALPAGTFAALSGVAKPLPEVAPSKK